MAVKLGNYFRPSFAAMLASAAALTLILPVPAGAREPDAQLADELVEEANRTLDQAFAQIAAEAAPAVYDEIRRDDGVTELYFESVPYEGRQTRVFALYNFPDKPLVIEPGKVPAVVLVHGGAGSAFADWVKLWNDAGFAAISIAVEGQTDVRPADRARGRWERHDHSGPPRAGLYRDDGKPLNDQWMFHAVAASLKARNFLEEQPGIDPEAIGISGISWGGIITSTVMGFDPEFSFAIPIYGTGFLDGMDNQYRRLAANSVYRGIWEPGHRLKRYRNPSLWLTWRKDRHFSLDAQAKTYAAVGGPYSVSIKPGIGHGHKGGWGQEEGFTFARHVVLTGKPWGLGEPLETTGNFVNVQFSLSPPQAIEGRPIAVLHTTTDTGHTGQAEWSETELDVFPVNSQSGAFAVQGQLLSDDVAHWFVNLRVNMIDQASGKAVPVIVSSRVVSP